MKPYLVDVNKVLFEGKNIAGAISHGIEWCCSTEIMADLEGRLW